MTATSDDTALLAAIRQHPDEDTPRLAFADWLQENGDEARAELIRLQCLISRCVRHGDGCCEADSRVRALLAANEARWRAGPKCERCGGKGEYVTPTNNNPLFRTMTVACLHCDRTGDAGGLMRKLVYDPSDVPGEDCAELVRVTYHRGMARVHCRAADVWEQYEVCRACRWTNSEDHRHGCCPNCGSDWHDETMWRPTAWAMAVCRHHPDVTEVWIEDLNPVGTPRGYYWHEGNVPIAKLAMAMVGDQYPTPEAAKCGLANAVVRWTWGFVK